MITNEVREKLKLRIGPKWIGKINGYLVEERIYNRYNEPYTSTYISRVFNGTVENPIVEKAIWDFAEKRKQEDEAEEERQKAILDGVEPDEPAKEL